MVLIFIYFILRQNKSLFSLSA